MHENPGRTVTQRELEKLTLQQLQSLVNDQEELRRLRGAISSTGIEPAREIEQMTSRELADWMEEALREILVVSRMTAEAELVRLEKDSCLINALRRALKRAGSFILVQKPLRQEFYDEMYDEGTLQKMLDDRGADAVVKLLRTPPF